MDKERIRYLDVARGIAMISIVLGHLGNAGINRVVFTYHLPIFYLMSGYFFDSKSSLGTFTLKKIRRLLIPYAVACVFFCLMSIANRWYNNKELFSKVPESIFASLYGAGDKWEKPFVIYPIGALWFIWATFWGEVFLKLLLKCHFMIRIISVVGLLLACCHTWQIIWLPLSIQASGCALLYMYMGYLLRTELAEIRAVKLSNEVKLAGSLLALAMWLWTIHTFTGFWLVHSHIGNGLTDILGSLCGCYLLLIISRYIDRWIPVLRTVLSFMGRYSLLFLTYHAVELRWMPYKKLYKHFIQQFALTASDNLFLGYCIVFKLALISICMLLTCFLPPVRAIFGYPPLRKPPSAVSGNDA